MVRAVGLGQARAEQGQRDGQVGEHHDVPAVGVFLPYEMHSVWTPAQPWPPRTVLSVVIWIAATWGLACPFPRWAATLVAVIWMKSLSTPPPAKMAAVPA